MRGMIAALRGVCMAGLVVAGLTAGIMAEARAEQATVAVAANFKEVVAELQKLFEKNAKHRLTVTAGSTGKLYAQIKHGAPFDVLLAADQKRPQLLEEEGDAVLGSRFTYAVGQIALWSPNPERIAAHGLDTLKAGDFDNLAIANPDLAPYGVAARQTLQHYGLWDALSGKIVKGQNIGQTFAMVATENAQMGFVAKSYVLSPSNDRPGSRWDVPAKAHDPIRQDAILLARAADNQAARAFMAFLRSDEARAVIERFGYAAE